MSRFSELSDAHTAENDGRPVPETARVISPGTRQLPIVGQAFPIPSSQVDTSAGRVDWVRAWRIAQKHWRVSAAFAGSVMITVVLVTALTKPVYAPSARVEIDPPGAELFNMEDRGRSEMGADYLETQARNMQSDELLVAVIRQLELDRVPEFVQRGPITQAVGIALSSIEKIPVWLRGEKKPERSIGANPTLLILSSSEASTLRAMQAQLAVDRDTSSRLVTVSFASHDPVLSATVTNTIVRSFIERTYQTRHDAIVQSTEWLARQLDDIRAKMEESNRALAEFQRVNGIADVDQYRSTFTDQLAELSRQKTQAQADRIQIESQLRGVRDEDVENLPQIQSNQVVQMLTQKLGEVRADLSQTLAVYGRNHPNVKRLQNQSEELESQIKLQRKALIGGMETSYAAALSREQLINNRLRGTSRELGQMAQYTALKKEAQSNADLYNALYSRVKEAGIAAASKSINIRIVDQARVLDKPTRPNPLLNLGSGLCIALIGGILLALIREAFDHKVHTIEDVRQSLGISAVSMLPLAVRNGRSVTGFRSSMLGIGEPAAGVSCPTNFLLEEPTSVQSEALRGIHTSVMLSQPGHPPRVILIASSLPGEGKTTVAINLAVALVRQGRTCILDADLRRPSVGRAFKVETTAGLGEYLARSTSLDSILTPAPKVQGLTIIAAGNTSSDSEKLSDINDVKALVGTLRDMYEFVVIDSPPILPYSEGRALARFVDGVVFVGRAGIVTREAMARSMELLREVHSAPVLEVVLNGTRTGDRSYGYHYGYESPSR